MTSAPGPAPGFRCAITSREVGEAAEGTASTVRSFLLVECPGPWGVDALRDSRLPEPVKARLRELERTAGVRPLLVRRPGRAVAGALTVFAAYAGTDGSWLERTVVPDLAQLPDATLADIAAGTSPGWAPCSDPVFAVCTHGRHDACCAERGRPLVAALAGIAPDLTWEVSHIGGDRFAANVLVLPHGLYYGRLEPRDAHDLVASHAAGRLDLEHLRGRTAYSFPLQAADIYLRRHLGDDRAAPFGLVSHARRGSDTDAVFDVDGRRWRVQVTSSADVRRQVTCRATSESAPPVHRLSALTELT